MVTPPISKDSPWTSSFLTSATPSETLRGQPNGSAKPSSSGSSPLPLLRTLSIRGVIPVDASSMPLQTRQRAFAKVSGTLCGSESKAEPMAADPDPVTQDDEYVGPFEWGLYLGGLVGFLMAVLATFFVRSWL